MRSHLLITLLFLTGFVATAQPAYWLLLTDKDPRTQPALSPQTVANRQALALPIDETDRPVSGTYLSQLQALGIQVRCQSRWLNAVSARLSEAQLGQVRLLPFVREVRAIDPAVVITALRHTGPSSTPKLAPVMAQIEAQAFIAENLTGRFVQIGVIDAGFFAADSVNALKAIAKRGGYRQVRDYVNRPKTQDNLFRTLESYADTHGTEVLAAIAGHDPVGNVQFGLGPDATFYLARTDAGNREFRGEEDNWVQAMEWLDSLGVRLVNTSLGYARGFTNPKENYETHQMDGHTSLISRAAQMAVDKKGMLIIVSAGNEGDDRAWRIISTPADAEGVLTVGATNANYWNRIGYSSIGPEPLPYLKPNVSCFSLYGTSLSAPVITGFAACLMQAKPDLTNRQLREIIEKSAHLYPYGNNYVGYGVPQATRALALLRGQALPQTAREVRATGKQFVLPLTQPEAAVSVFRKKDATHVLRQEVIKPSKNKLTIKRLTGEARTTIDLKREVVEVVWE
jgi:subtilisin